MRYFACLCFILLQFNLYSQEQIVLSDSLLPDTRGCERDPVKLVNKLIEGKQGEKEKYMPTLYVHCYPGTSLPGFSAALENAILKNTGHAGLNLEKVDELTWKVSIPDQYKVGHEAHFSQVTEKYLEYLKAGKLPEWEVPNMIVKYYTATEALKMARR